MKTQKKMVSQPFQCKSSLLSGHRFADILPGVRQLFRAIEKKTKRRPYIRSAYFHKEKIQFDYFWEHLQRKSLPDRARRLRLFPATIELLRQSRQGPVVSINVQRPGRIRFQFDGKTKDRILFTVIVEQDQRTGTKQLLTCYPQQSK